MSQFYFFPFFPQWEQYYFPVSKKKNNCCNNNNTIHDNVNMGFPQLCWIDSELHLKVKMRNCIGSTPSVLL